MVEALTTLVETLNGAPAFPFCTVTVAGTLATPGLLLESDTVAPDGGAAVDNTAAPLVFEPPATGESTTRFCSVTWGAPAGVTVNVAVLVVLL